MEWNWAMEASFVFCYHKQRPQCTTPQFMHFGWISKCKKDEYSSLFLSLKKFMYVYFVVSFWYNFFFIVMRKHTSISNFSLYTESIPYFFILELQTIKVRHMKVICNHSKNHSKQKKGERVNHVIIVACPEFPAPLWAQGLCINYFFKLIH